MDFCSRHHILHIDFLIHYHTLQNISQVKLNPFHNLYIIHFPNQILKSIMNILKDLYQVTHNLEFNLRKRINRLLVFMSLSILNRSKCLGSQHISCNFKSLISMPSIDLLNGLIQTNYYKYCTLYSLIDCKFNNSQTRIYMKVHQN